MDASPAYRRARFHPRRFPELGAPGSAPSYIGKPTVFVFLDELVVIPAPVGRRHAVDLLGLPGEQRLFWIEAPGAFDQSLAPKHLQDSRDAAPEAVGGVEERSVRVGHFDRRGQESLRDRIAPTSDRMDLVEKLDGALCPNRPMAEEPADEMRGLRSRRRVDAVLTQEVGDDRIVVTGVERDLALPPGVAQGANDVERLVTVERCDLDRHDVVDLGELAPKLVGKLATADRRL